MKATGRAVIVAIAAAAALSVTPASGAASDSESRDAAKHSLKFDVKFRDFQKNYLDLGAPGPTVGDLIVFQDRLFSTDRHRQVGVQGGTCTVTSVPPAVLQIHCVGTASLPGGQISFEGLATDAPVKLLAVVGGTGGYQGVSGEATLVENGDGTGTGQDDGTGTLTIVMRGARS